MSKADLLEIMSLLPEYCLERSIKECLYQLFVIHDWEPLDFIMRAVFEKCAGRNLLLAEITVIAVQYAIRTRNMPLAISRFKDIALYGDTQDFINLKTDALFHLAVGLLPEQPAKLKKLWDSCLGDKLPFHAQRLLVQIGVMTAYQFCKNNDVSNARVLCQIMRKTIGISTKIHDFLALEKQLSPN